MMAESKATAGRLRQQYQRELKAKLMEQLGLSNVHEVPRLEKVVVSVGLGRAKEEKRVIEAAVNTLRKITGQQPVQTLAKKSIASFKLREGQPIGLKVTLRSERMYEFVDRLVNVVMPRVRDFHGVSSSSFDGHGNYSLGFIDQSIWPELSFDDTAVPHGVEVTMITNSDSDVRARALLESLGLPFVKEEAKSG